MHLRAAVAMAMVMNPSGKRRLSMLQSYAPAGGFFHRKIGACEPLPE
jgi:hypothetical protein